MDKGALQAQKKKKKKAHVESKTGTVTWSRVALTARQNHTVPVFIFLLRGFRSPIFFLLCSSILIFRVVFVIKLNWNATSDPPQTRLLSLVSRISLSSVGHCASFGSQTLLSLADIPPLLLFLLGIACWVTLSPPCQSNLGSESRAASRRNEEVQRRLLRKKGGLSSSHLDPKRNKPPVWFRQTWAL